MSKTFFEVFPAMQVTEELRALFKETEVEKLSTNHERTRYKVTLRSGHLIHRKYIVSMEEELARQVFGTAGSAVFIRDIYSLSSQFEPVSLMRSYRESLVYEFGLRSRVAASLFREAGVSYPETGVIRVDLEDSCFAREHAPRMQEFLERVFSERCGVPAHFEFCYHAAPERVIRREVPEWQPVAAMAEDSAAQSVANAGFRTGDAGEEHAGGAAEAGRQQSGAGAGDSGGRSGGSSPAPASAGGSGASRRRDQFSGAQRGSGGRTGRGRRAGDRERGFGGYRRSENPACLYGRDIDPETQVIPISEIIGEIGEVMVRGQIMKAERRDIRNDKSIIKFSITDFTDSIWCKLFIGTGDAEGLLAALRPGAFVKVQGMTQNDSYDHEVVIGSLRGVQSIPSFVKKRRDEAPVRRVELHCHTKMSDMDGVSECRDLVRQAYEWGMPAIAITDHGNVQAFPDAAHLRSDLMEAENKRRRAEGLEPIDEQKFFKVIYGLECYLVDDLRPVAELGSRESADTRLDSRVYTVFDIETTGLSAQRDRVIQIGGYRVELFREEPEDGTGRPGRLTGRIAAEFSELIDPKIPIPYKIQQLTQIDDNMVIGKDTIDRVLPRFLEFAKGTVLVGHNVAFDCGFLEAKCRELGLPYDFSWADTMGMARAELPGHGNYRLETVARGLGVVLEQHHRGDKDALCTAEIFIKLLPLLEKDHAETFGALNRLNESNADVVHHLRYFHCIILAKNVTGRTNLYRLVSESHLRYYARKPRIPRSLLLKYREGLILGSACIMGELMSAMIDDRSEQELARIAGFYDYLEIQPIANNRFLIDSRNKNGEKRYPAFNTDEDLRNLNRRVVELGAKLGKPVCATCDVHFKEPEDEIYRNILQRAIGMTEEESAPLYLRTTQEMLDEFSYLGAQKCEEVVVTNTRRIADCIDAVSPVRPDKCPPVIPHSDEMLREICYRKAHEMYGDPLPEVVEKRLERELTSIIQNGYSVMYIIAQKLVWKSNEDGYLVGSRGSVGSSFVATMAGITEVNPLAPHYLCPNPECRYSDFDSPVVKEYELRTGIDLPERMCPRCGTRLQGLGFGIPFETFLGFKGDKEPDIDLNFSGEYQSKAHAYTKVIFGQEQTFKAGTIATVADKTAYGYVRGFFRDRADEAAAQAEPSVGTTAAGEKRQCELERIAAGLVGVRRSTGQHPGGIVVLPVGEEINSFTPVQHPANDMTTDIVTTHFDYHSIDHNLLKLDILGHDDPTMIRILQDLTGVDPMGIPLNDPDVMSLFQSTQALGVRPEDIGGISVGTLGIPEFGTKFVMGMLEATKPTTMTELVKISGLSHGTDVYLGNAETHISQGDCTLLTCIGCRDDIMSYLIAQGVDDSMSFKIMENVRKGKVAKGACREWPQWQQEMKAHGVPDWYIDSCQKIKYMFPKGHAAAYVMMALRIAWFKVHDPLAYYCAYFSIRATDFDYEIMAQGAEHLEKVMKDYEGRKDSLTAKEQATMDDMKLVEEFYARGLEFMPIDLTMVQSRLFRIIDGRLMPSLKSIVGMGEKAADAVVEAVKDGPFLSKNDFRSRTKVSQTNIEQLSALGILKDLPETDQISLFDLMGGFGSAG